MAFFQNLASPRAARRAATHMTFRVGGQLYGVPIDMVAEVAATSRMAPIVGGDPAVRGEMELRGDALVVVDMGLRLRGAPIAESSERGCVLIVRREAARSGCLLGPPEGVLSIAEGEIELSGCLVDEAGSAAAIAGEDVKSPENAAVSGAAYGFPLYRMGDETVLLPPRDAFYPG